MHFICGWIEGAKFKGWAQLRSLWIDVFYAKDGVWTAADGSYSFLGTSGMWCAVGYTKRSQPKVNTRIVAIPLVLFRQW